MRIRVTKYILTLSVILMACFGYLFSHSPFQGDRSGSGVVTHIDSLHKNADHVEALFSAYDAGKAKFTTDNNDTEEELAGPAKKLLKASGCFFPSFYSRAGYLSQSVKRCSYPVTHLTAFTPQRLFIKFRVIRL